MPKVKRPKYSGILAQPLVCPKPGNGLWSVSETECMKRNFTAIVDRFLALYKHYDQTTPNLAPTFH